MNTQDERIRHITTITLAITAAVPASFQLFGVNPNLIFLGIAGLLFLLCLTLCVIATAKDKLMIVSIKSLFADYLQCPELTAKVALIKYAGEDQEINIRRIVADVKDNSGAELFWSIGRISGRAAQADRSCYDFPCRRSPAFGVIRSFWPSIGVCGAGGTGILSCGGGCAGFG